MKMFRRLVLWAMLAALPAAIAQSQAYPDDVQAALAGGSARLQLFALMAARPEGAGPYVGQLQRHLGLDHPAGAGPRYVSHSVALSPILEHDSNINGGTPGGFIMLGGLKFTLTESSRAKSGLVAGLAPSASLRLSLGQGRTVEASASGSVARALEYDLTRRSFGFRLCGAQYLGRADWLDICAGRRGSDKALSSSQETHASVGFARQYATARGFHEASMRLEQVDNGTFKKTSLDFGVTHAAARLGVVDWRVELGEHIAGQHTRLGGVTLSLTRPILGAQSTIFVAGSQEGGAVFFGNDRVDRSFRVGLSRNVTPRASVTLSLEDRRSTLENYTGTSVGFSVNIAFKPLSGG